MAHANYFTALFRSEKMEHCQILLHVESAFECLVQLGYMGVVQFIPTEINHEDENYNKYLPDILRCNYILMHIKHLEHEIKETQMRSVYFPDTDLDDVPGVEDMKALERKVLKLADDLVDIDRNISALRRREGFLKEEYYVLNHVQDVLKGQNNTERIMAWSDSVVMDLIRDEATPDIERVRPNEQKLRFCAGTVPVEHFKAFEIMLFRLCHHNFYIHKENIPEPLADIHGTPIRKLAFMCVYVGIRVGQIISKICMGFAIKPVQVSVSSAERLVELEKVEKDLLDLKRIFDRAYFERSQILAVASGDIFIWKVKVLKMSAIYTQLNGMSTLEDIDQNKYLKCYAWIPEDNINKVKKALLRGARRAGQGDMGMMFPPSLTILDHGSTHSEPPSLFVLNKFTKPFQALIDAYGIPDYQELNPAPYTVVTFPFLFSIMFGDLGHGSIMFGFAFWMILNEEEFEENKKKTKNVNEIWDMMFMGRYIIIMMGLFSIYTGFIYNDCFSLSMNLFGSRWTVDSNSSVALDPHLTFLILNPASRRQYVGDPYIFGVDPIWHVGDSAIVFLNSFKMKVAIIVGFIHMIFGLFLFASNCVFAQNAVDLYFIFLPQIVFLTSIFGYLALLIFVKWCTFGADYETPYNSACAPPLLLTFINMLMFKDAPKPPRGCLSEMFSGQGMLQFLFLILALLSVPVLFFGKPITLWRRNKEIIKREMEEELRTRRQEESVDLEDLLETGAADLDAENLEKSYKRKIKNPELVDMSEEWIHSSIHSVEFLLGTISHTASYLRLWALSLAHEQLSRVLWMFMFSKVFKTGWGLPLAAMMVPAFLVWAFFTIAVMVIMEGLSAFLHTLRLHWVEFQSKFYNGTGGLFHPFKFVDASKVDLL